jgi:hypothetical protein
MVDFMVGNGLALGLVLCAIAVVLIRGKTASWPGLRRTPIIGEILITGAVILMLLAGTLATGVGFGHWAVDVLLWFEHVLHRAGPWVMFFTAAIGTVWVGHEIVNKGTAVEAMYIAFVLPFVLATFRVGPFAQLDIWLEHNAQFVVAWIEQKAGVSS